MEKVIDRAMSVLIYEHGSIQKSFAGYKCNNFSLGVEKLYKTTHMT